MREPTFFVQAHPHGLKTYGGAMESRQRFLRTSEAATYLAVSRKTHETLRVRGGGPRYLRPPGRRLVLYAVEDLEAWATAGARASTADSDHTA